MLSNHSPNWLIIYECRKRLDLLRTSHPATQETEAWKSEVAHNEKEIIRQLVLLKDERENPPAPKLPWWKQIF